MGFDPKPVFPIGKLPIGKSPYSGAEFGDLSAAPHADADTLHPDLRFVTPPNAAADFANPVEPRIPRENSGFVSFEPASESVPIVKVPGLTSWPAASGDPGSSNQIQDLLKEAAGDAAVEVRLVADLNEPTLNTGQQLELHRRSPEQEEGLPVPNGGEPVENESVPQPNSGIGGKVPQEMEPVTSKPLGKPSQHAKQPAAETVTGQPEPSSGTIKPQASS
jgi:hypothetical protein